MAVGLAFGVGAGAVAGVGGGECRWSERALPRGALRNHAAYKMQRATCGSVQDAACNMRQRTRCSVQQAAYNRQRTTCSVQHAACNMQPGRAGSCGAKAALCCARTGCVSREGRVGGLSWQGSPCRAGYGGARPCCAVRRLRSALREALWLVAAPQVLHQTGRGCRHDLEAAAAWYRLAVQHGHVPAMVRHVAGLPARRIPPDTAATATRTRSTGGEGHARWVFGGIDGAVCARMCVYARIWGLCEHAHMHTRRRFM
jgi:hypothetical protein